MPKICYQYWKLKSMDSWSWNVPEDLLKWKRMSISSMLSWSAVYKLLFSTISRNCLEVSCFFSFCNENMLSFVFCFQTLMNVRSCQGSAKVEIASILLAVWMSKRLLPQWRDKNLWRFSPLNLLLYHSAVTMKSNLIFNLNSMWICYLHPDLRYSLKWLGLGLWLR